METVIGFRRLATLLIVNVLAFGASCTITTRPQRSTVPIESWTTENKTFKIRVTSYGEKGAMVSGTYYVFESSSRDAAGWHEIMTFRHDDRPAIPKDQIRFLDDKTAYAFMGWMAAVTFDGGSNWSIWDARKDLPNWQCCNHQLIRSVQLATDGTGRMSLNPIPERRGEVPELHTADYGRHWNPQ